MIMVFIYDILSSSKEVYSGHLVQEADPLLLTATIFFIVLLFFHVIARIERVNTYNIPASNLKVAILLNFFSAGAWIGFFFSVKFLEPAIVSSLMVGVGPSLSVVASPFLYAEVPRYRWKLMTSLGILGGATYLIIIGLLGESSVAHLTLNNLCLGGSAAVLGSISMVGASIYSKHLSDLGASPASIMAHRFYILVPLSILLAVMGGGNLAFPRLEEVFGLSFFGVIIPLWCLQIGIRHLAPTEVMTIIAVAPAFTYLIQAFDPRLEMNFSVFWGVIVICGFAIISQRPPKLTRGGRSQ